MLFNFKAGIFFLFLLINLSVVSTVTAQNNSILRLMVTEEGGQPIVSANVLLFEEGKTEFSRYGITNRDGFVEFRNLLEGVYSIKISYVGFEALEQSFELKSGETKIEQIVLIETLSNLGEVQVTAEGEFQTGEVGVTRVRAEDIDRVISASIEGDLMAYIQTMPGIVTIGDQGGDLYIRGGTPSQNQVLVDNIPLVKPFHISNLFSAFPEKVVGSAYVMAGGFDNSYMGSTSAVIDVNLRSGDLREASASGSFSPYLSSLFLETPVKKDHSSLLISGRTSTIKKFSGYLSTEKQDIQFYDLIARYSMRVEGYNCSATGMLTGDEGVINKVRNINLSWENKAIGVRCFGFDKNFAHPFEVSLGYSTYSNAEGNSQNTERDASVNQAFMRMDFEEEWLNLQVDYGLNLMFKSFQSKANERFAAFDDGFDLGISLLQLYGKTRYDFSQNLSLEPGLSLQMAMAHGELKSTFEPRARLKYNPFENQNSEISFAVGLYSQVMEGITDQRDAGSTFTMYQPVERGNPLPQAFHAIISFRNKLGSYWGANVEAYYKNHDNTPIAKWTQRTGIATELTLANGETYGLDFRLEYKRNAFYWYAGYGLGKVKYSAESGNLGGWLEGAVTAYSPAHDQRHKVNAMLSYELAEFSFNINWEFSTGMPYTQLYATDLSLRIPMDDPITEPGRLYSYYYKPYTERLPVNHRLDASLKRFFKIAERIELGTEAGIINAYDRRNVFFLDVEEFQVVYQTRLLPYISFNLSFN